MAKTGRPCSFDREQAVTDSMYLFWQYGYDSTTLNLLTSQIGGGISAPSFYAAFKSKEYLFREIISRYMTLYSRKTNYLNDESLSSSKSIEEILYASAKMQTDQEHPKGCLLVLSANTCSQVNLDVRNLLSTIRDANRRSSLLCIRRGIANKEFKINTDENALSLVFHTFLTGVTTQARDGVPAHNIMDSIKDLIRLFDYYKTEKSRQAND
ncbi:TetR/AcrR family transcriptional regulator [Pantoea cypripedii]|uniref:TetR/AcrR family transcriptional regulator n=1 Tax=Pantoea cypripedii TaxID=55209 RepID=UPI000A10E78B|nr:TetR/AcrR family transcriptional regulator [Pantoea cypripedii]MBP2195121.1 TetR/AcrR family transcriptional repressor for divergent bdcA [Pantoea cypripedii]